MAVSRCVTPPARNNSIGIQEVLFVGSICLGGKFDTVETPDKSNDSQPRQKVPAPENTNSLRRRTVSETRHLSFFPFRFTRTKEITEPVTAKKFDTLPTPLPQQTSDAKKKRASPAPKQRAPTDKPRNSTTELQSVHSLPRPPSATPVAEGTYSELRPPKNKQATPDTHNALQPVRATPAMVDEGTYVAPTPRPLDATYLELVPYPHAVYQPQSGRATPRRAAQDTYVNFSVQSDEATYIQPASHPHGAYQPVSGRSTPVMAAPHRNSHGIYQPLPGRATPVMAAPRRNSDGIYQPLPGRATPEMVHRNPDAVHYSPGRATPRRAVQSTYVDFPAQCDEATYIEVAPHPRGEYQPKSGRSTLVMAAPERNSGGFYQPQSGRSTPKKATQDTYGNFRSDEATPVMAVPNTQGSPKRQPGRVMPRAASYTQLAFRPQPGRGTLTTIAENAGDDSGPQWVLPRTTEDTDYGTYTRRREDNSFATVEAHTRQRRGSLLSLNSHPVAHTLNPQPVAHTLWKRGSRCSLPASVSIPNLSDSQSFNSGKEIYFKFSKQCWQQIMGVLQQHGFDARHIHAMLESQENPTIRKLGCLTNRTMPFQLACNFAADAIEAQSPLTPMQRVAALIGVVYACNCKYMVLPEAVRKGDDSYRVDWEMVNVLRELASLN
eukprot:Blabericola_migrator_1__3041@NODE_1885_length_3606_cov_196_697937_g1207_i0_p1_GENE_NODE_1885_length_3606_cov_196_697937_g1207_i0NODE_1885_length_3606_cov_196_697937_g1207_i0_p1_ORF_typecomplete_len663_score69_98_NODE_1885_length_3606_cov_196_697937_g1207_i015243512